eukprot:GHVT01105121.1.p1 GENE.GHVT01105121.1~~GHVT01105121.1.p1  ORF type:complete len:192 (-),score=7.60 GHVT01105121.1:77-652(-)
MRYRLGVFDTNAYKQQMQRLRDFTRKLHGSGLQIPGISAPVLNFWLYPVLTPRSLSPQDFCAKLQKFGVDARRGTTQLIAVDPPSTGCYPEAQTANELMKRVVYLPAHRYASTTHLDMIFKSCSYVIQSLKRDERSAKGSALNTPVPGNCLFSVACNDRYKVNHVSNPLELEYVRKKLLRESPQGHLTAAL